MLAKLIRDKLSIEVPETVSSVLPDNSLIPGFGKLNMLTADGLQYEEVGEDVVVTHPNGNKLTFVPVDSEYQASVLAKLPEDKHDKYRSDMATMAGAVYDGNNQFVDELSSQISGGEINAENLEAESNQIAARTIDPVNEKLVSFMTVVD
jgi:hypothetical protein